MRDLGQGRAPVEGCNPISVRLGGSVISVNCKDVHCWKAPTPILARLRGSVISLKIVQKVHSPISARLGDLGQGRALLEGVSSNLGEVGHQRDRARKVEQPEKAPFRSLFPRRDYNGDVNSDRQRHLSVTCARPTQSRKASPAIAMVPNGTVTANVPSTPGSVRRQVARALGEATGHAGQLEHQVEHAVPRRFSRLATVDRCFQCGDLLGKRRGMCIDDGRRRRGSPSQAPSLRRMCASSSSPSAPPPPSADMDAIVTRWRRSAVKDGRQLKTASTVARLGTKEFFYGMGFGDGGGRGGRGRGGGRGGGRGFAPDWICLACKQSNFAKVGPIPPTAPPPFIFWYPQR